MFEALSQSLGPSHWWPADSPFEIAIGAILTQNTNWSNVEKALDNLKANQRLSPLSLYQLSPPQLLNSFDQQVITMLNPREYVTFLNSSTKKLT